MPLTTLSSWKDYFSTTKGLNSSDCHLIRIHDSVGSSIPFLTSLEEISKNPGISFLLLDPSESHLQLFHHCTTIGGSWDSPSQNLVCILDFDITAKPIQLIQKSIKDVRHKTYSFEVFATSLESSTHYEALTKPTSIFHYKNIIPIPHLLTKTFMNLPSTDPYTVARAFFEQMYDYDSQVGDADSDSSTQEPTAVEHDLANDSDHDSTPDLETVANPKPSTNTSATTTHPKFMKDFIHIIQFCHLCAKGKITPVFYTLNTPPAVQSWFTSLLAPFRIDQKMIAKRASAMDNDNLVSDDEISSPDQKISEKDHYFINTMLKLHDTMDCNNLKQSKEKDEREPGFNRLELHRKNLILNASAPPPFDTQATQPTEILQLIFE
jgi:hypothetical protein